MQPDGSATRPVVEEPVSFLGYAEKPFGWSMPPNYSWSPGRQRLAYAAVRGGLSNLFTVNAAGAAETLLTSNAERELAFFLSALVARWQAAHLSRPAAQRGGPAVSGVSL